jgi:hypothetical protein
MLTRNLSSAKLLLALFSLTALAACRASAAEPQAESNAQLAVAIGTLESVKRTLEAADHDYGGHRAAAVHDCSAAEKQLREALNAVTSATGKGAQKRPKISEPQVLSNAQLAESIPVLRNIVKLLNSADHDYHGHREKAVKSTEKAIVQLEKALEHASGPRRGGGGTSGGVPGVGGGGASGGGPGVAGPGGTGAGGIALADRHVAKTTEERIKALRAKAPHHHRLHAVRKAESKAKHFVKHHHLAKKAKRAIKADKHAKRHSAAHHLKKVAKKHGVKKKGKKKK